MSERMLVTQALDEKDLLMKKIVDKIDNGRFIDWAKNNEDRGYITKLTRDEFAKNASALYQQIGDYIDRYNRIEAAIIQSNAATMVETSIGTMSVAAAITLRKRLRASSEYESDVDFNTRLANRMQTQYNQVVSDIDRKNSSLQSTAEDMRLSILGRDSKVRDDKPLAVVDSFVKENTAAVVDPLDVKAKVEAIRTGNENLLRELDTQIKVSNATTFIEF